MATQENSIKNRLRKQQQPPSVTTTAPADENRVSARNISNDGGQSNTGQTKAGKRTRRVNSCPATRSPAKQQPTRKQNSGGNSTTQTACHEIFNMHFKLLAEALALKQQMDECNNQIIDRQAALHRLEVNRMRAEMEHEKLMHQLEALRNEKDAKTNEAVDFLVFDVAEDIDHPFVQPQSEVRECETKETEKNSLQSARDDGSPDRRTSIPWTKLD